MKNSNIFYFGIGTFVLMGLVVTGLFLSPSSQRDISQTDIASVYEGESIRFLVPSAPGGGFDEYSRLLAPYLEQYTGASVKIMNLPGAGGMRVANELDNSPRNGLTIAILNGSGMVINRLAGIKGAGYQIEEFEYLGRVDADSRVLTVGIQSEYSSIDDIWNAEETVKIGVTGLGGSGYVDGVVSKEAFDLNVQIIHGFDSSSAVRQALLRGDIVGTWGSWGSAKDAVKSGLERVVLQSGRERIKDLPNVPAVIEFIDKTNDPERTRKILTAWDSLISVGRPVATTPGTAVDRVQFLRNAFRQAMHDPGFLQMTEERDRPVLYASDAEMIQIITDATGMEEDIEQLFIRATRGELYQ